MVFNYSIYNNADWGEIGEAAVSVVVVCGVTEVIVEVLANDLVGGFGDDGLLPGLVTIFGDRINAIIQFFD